MDTDTGYARHIVLVVDDDPVCRLFCAHALTTSGYRTFTASDGDSAIRTALDKKPQLVMTDIHLPDMHGTNVIARIGQLWPDGGTRPRFVALSGDDSPMPCNAAWDVGFDYSLIKPFSIEALLACVEKVENEFAHSSQSAEQGQCRRKAISEHKPQPALGLQLQSIFCMELNQRLIELDQTFTALNWVRTEEQLHRLSGAAALAGFSAFAGKGRALLRQLSQLQDFALLSQTYLEFLHQANELSQHQHLEADPGFRHHE